MDYLSRIAVVEDDPEISRMMTAYMTDHGFEVAAARSGRDLDRVMSSGNKIDCVILDVGLPGEDGLSICRRLRGKSTVPIIMVTGRGTDTDRIVGLELGADDYLPKPFNPRELLARVRAVMRRSVAPEPMPETPRILMFEGWRLDMSRRQLFAPDGAPRSLTSGEFNILSIFCQNPRKVLSRDDLLDLLHGRAAAVFDRSIDVQISRLRRKIETNLKDPSFIKTVRYGGYFFTPLVSPLADS